MLGLCHLYVSAGMTTIIKKKEFCILLCESQRVKINVGIQKMAYNLQAVEVYSDQEGGRGWDFVTFMSQPV